MKFTRRDFVHAGCLIGAASLTPSIVDRAEAGLHLHGSGGALPGRNVINLNNFSFGLNEYAFIDHIKGAVGSVGPFGNGFNNPAVPTFPSLLDANGWPNNASASGVNFGGGFNVPDPTNFGGPYTMDWVGNGEIDISLQGPIGAVGTWTTSGLTNCSVTSNSGGTLKVTSTGGASTASIQISFTSSGVGPQIIQHIISVTGTGGFFIKNLRWYRTAEASDLAAGKIWRAAWKQPLVDLCPSAIRCMNNLGGNSNFNNRFENRTLPSSAGYLQFCQWNISPSYSTNATGTNQYTVAAATPTAGNARNTSASMVHGEIATVRFTNGVVRASGGQVTISSITNAANGVVTTSSAHGFSTNDIIIHRMLPTLGVLGTMNGTITVTGLSSTANINIGMFVFGPGIQAGTTVSNLVGSTLTLSLPTTISGSNMGLGFSCMKNLDLFPCTITVTGATTYQLNVNTTAFGSFFATLGTALQYLSVQVGSGNDRTAYPLMLGNALPAAIFGSSIINSNDYKTLYFDKTISGKSDGAGNYILGAWMIPTTFGQGNIGHSGDLPIEVCVALVNELNAMSPAHTIGLWMNIPCWGLSTMDADYTTASDWAKNAVDVVMNPSSSVRAGGYSALGYSGVTQQNQPNLILEYSNELWPSGTNDGRLYLIERGIRRFGQAVLPHQDWQDLKSLRSACWARDVKSTNPLGADRIKYVLGIQGFSILIPNTSNYATIFGGAVTATPNQVGDWYTNDSLVTGGNWGRPIDNHDGMCGATYFDPPDGYYSTTTGTGTFTDDSAMFNGTNNSGNGGGNYTGAANPTQAVTNFVAQVVDIGNVNNSQSTTNYATVLLPQQAAAMPVGKVVIGYEGGPDWQVVAGTNQSGHVLTAGDAALSLAVLNSSQWATAQVDFFNAVNAIPKYFMPSIFIWIGGGTPSAPSQRWANCAPDTYATISGTPTEGAALTVNSPVWIAMGNRNRALSA